MLNTTKRNWKFQFQSNIPDFAEERHNMIVKNHLSDVIFFLMELCKLSKIFGRKLNSNVINIVNLTFIHAT